MKKTGERFDTGRFYTQNGAWSRRESKRPFHKQAVGSFAARMANILELMIFSGFLVKGAPVWRAF